MKQLTATVSRILQSRTFFWIVVGVFVLQAVWFALTAAYPMAFDENYHFGIIKIYAQQWLPFISSPPAGSAPLGDITRYDSYMYHYLMSFPYRFFTLFTHDQTTLIVLLRLVNVALFTSGIILFRWLIIRITNRPAIAHVGLLFLTLVPVVPFLAATINYDNLAFLMVPVVVGLALSTARAVRTGTGSALPFCLLLITGGLSSLIKYAFAPIFVAALLYVVVIAWRHRRVRPVRMAWQSFVRLGLLTKIGLIIGLVIAGGLLGERYGVNLVVYHTYEPDCSAVTSVSNCLQYGPWARNHNHAQLVATTNPPFDPAPVLFVPAWIGGMILRLFFAINSNYANAPPLPLPITIASIVGGLGLVTGIIWWRRLARALPELWLVLLVVAIYVASLFFDNLSDYLHYRTMLAINGRYLILILPLFFIVALLGIEQFVLRVFKRRARAALTLGSVVVFLLMLQGGGMLTQLVQSDTGWYLPGQAGPSLEAQKIVAPLIVNGEATR